MCGIVGVVGRPVAPDHLERMAAEMHHRGPDAAGVCVWPDGGFAHRRLSVLDLSAAANQPFCDPQGAAVLTFNGEIYNHRELRAELERHGGPFRTRSDTEVLLRGWLHWGERVVERLSGMFAFAVWDHRRRLLFLARDRLGKKPLFLATLPDGSLAFASELKALLASGWIDTRADPEALLDYLHLNYVLCPRTPLQQVRQLPPGHFAIWQQGRLRHSAYWRLREHFLAPRLEATRHDLLDELEAKLDEAVRARLCADVPLGAFLSGGLDSSMVVAHARRARPDGLHTFSIESAATTNDDTRFSRLSARHLGTIHHPAAVDDLTPDDLVDYARRIDLPLGDDSTVSVFRLAQWTRSHVTVALSGDGADEAFAGYATYRADRIHRRLGPLRRVAALLLGGLAPLLAEGRAKLSRRFQFRRLADGLRREATDAHFTWRQCLAAEDLRQICDPGLLEAARGYSPADVFRDYAAEVAEADWLDRHLYVDCMTWLPDDILAKVDRASMAHSLEVRSPFLDHRLLEFAARLPRRFKLAGRVDKVALRHVARRRLPAAILHRRKEGFNSPTRHWMTGPLRELVRDVLTGGALEPLGLCSRGIERLWDRFQAGQREYQYALWGLFMLGLWVRQVLQPARNGGRKASRILSVSSGHVASVGPVPQETSRRTGTLARRGSAE